MSTSTQGFEIDFLPVGDGKSGDAIAVRFGNLHGQRSEQKVIVIDGGFQESGENLVKHIKTYYQTDHVDLAFSTHPDGDHAAGLSVVLENLSVGTLAMHRPWEHAAAIKNLFKNGRITVKGLERRLDESLQHVSDLEAIATKRKIPIVEPFEGVNGFDGRILVLGPSMDYYQTLLSDFRCTPEAATPLTLASKFMKLTEKAKEQIRDFLHIDLLNDEEDTTSAENNTSTIILVQINGQKLLFTGDAGKTALLRAISYAESIGISLGGMRFLQVPHHGSKRNLNSRVLKKINASIAFVSACDNHDKHPSKKVTNALQKHGAKVYVTRNIRLRYYENAPARNWGNATAEPFHDYVDE